MQILLFATLLPCIFMARADMMINISGTIARPPCVINANQMINVDFGDNIVTTRVSEDAFGNQNMQPIVYTLKCDRNVKARMKILGTPSPFDERLLATGKDNLAIAIRTGNTILAVNSTEYEFTYPNYPALIALPVKAPAAALDEGKFDIGATLELSFP
ncbi:fimbrial protein [Serratia nevei]|uniref:fimbrial protein n=1 Tax=Serratia nevei TaxID=2703794 RepID=UPI00313DBA5E